MAHCRSHGAFWHDCYIWMRHVKKRPMYMTWHELFVPVSWWSRDLRSALITRPRAEEFGLGARRQGALAPQLPHATRSFHTWGFVRCQGLWGVHTLFCSLFPSSYVGHDPPSFVPKNHIFSDRDPINAHRLSADFSKKMFVFGCFEWVSGMKNQRGLPVACNNTPRTDLRDGTSGGARQLNFGWRTAAAELPLPPRAYYDCQKNYPGFNKAASDTVVLYDSVLLCLHIKHVCSGVPKNSKAFWTEANGVPVTQKKLQISVVIGHPDIWSLISSVSGLKSVHDSY